MLVKDLAGRVFNGEKPVVEFCGNVVAELDTYAEPGIRATLVACAESRSGASVALTFDFSEFEEYNREYESANYFDKAGRETLTAREAGRYTDQLTLNIDRDDPLGLFFRLLEPVTGPDEGDFNEPPPRVTELERKQVLAMLRSTVGYNECDHKAAYLLGAEQALLVLNRKQ